MTDYKQLVEELRFGAENGCDFDLVERAANAIEELSPLWIRTEDRLPDMDGYDWVIGVVNGGCKHLRFKNAVMEVSYDPEFKEWFIDDLPEAKITVSHWMMLPQLPEGIA